MIITCAHCSTAFAVPVEAIGASGRRVRCSQCSHEWLQLPELQTPYVPLATASKPVQILFLKALIGRASRWIANHRTPQTSGWAAVALATVVVVGGGLAGREEIVHAWPASARLYDTVGTPVEIPGIGLELRNGMAHPIKTSQGTAIQIEGQIVNTSGEVRRVPSLRAELMKADDAIALHDEIIPSHEKLLPGEVATFEAILNDVPNGIGQVAVTFHDG